MCLSFTFFFHRISFFIMWPFSFDFGYLLSQVYDVLFKLYISWWYFLCDNIFWRFHSPSKEVVIGRTIVPPVSDDVQLSTEEYRNKLYEVLSPFLILSFLMNLCCSQSHPVDILVWWFLNPVWLLQDLENCRLIYGFVILLLDIFAWSSSALLRWSRRQKWKGVGVTRPNTTRNKS